MPVREEVRGRHGDRSRHLGERRRAAWPAGNTLSVWSAHGHLRRAACRRRRHLKEQAMARQSGQRPVCELLEDRTLPAQGLFIENFANDTDQTQPGWDSWDTDPATMPPGPDEFHFRNNFPAYPATNGPTATG